MCAGFVGGLSGLLPVCLLLVERLLVDVFVRLFSRGKSLGVTHKDEEAWYNQQLGLKIYPIMFGVLVVLVNAFCASCQVFYIFGVDWGNWWGTFFGLMSWGTGPIYARNDWRLEVEFGEWLRFPGFPEISLQIPSFSFAMSIYDLRAAHTIAWLSVLLAPLAKMIIELFLSMLMLVMGRRSKGRVQDQGEGYFSTHEGL